MASINYAAREISVKIVYYGPGLSGKTTNLQVIHRKVPPEFKSDMVSLATETDRTLFFDFLPLDLGKIKGFSTKFQLYTVPGQVYYNATRKLVLRGVDGVVFVADSAADKMQENHESFKNLEENLAEYGYQRESIPIILQYNKRDLPNALSIDELQQQFNKYDLPWSEAVANKGKGVFDSLKLIGKIVIDFLNKKYSRQPRASGGQDTSAMAAAEPKRPQYAQAQPQAAPQYQPPRPQSQPTPPPQSFLAPRQGYPPPPQQQAPSRPAMPPQTSYPPRQNQFAPPAPQARNQFEDVDTFEPRPAPRNAAPAPVNEDYFNYGNISLEPMGNQRRPEPPRGPQQQAAPEASRDGQGKTDLDLEIEKYQREIEEKQRKMRSQPSAAPIAQAPMPPAAPQRPAYFPPKPPQQMVPPGMPMQQPRQQARPMTSQNINQNDYDVYNMEDVQSAAPTPQTTRQPVVPVDEGDDAMYFTSVNPDRQKKPVKRPVNPRNKQQKGFLSKLFNREAP